jgi:hypothetical protein
MWNIPIVTFEFVAQSVAKGSLIPHQQYLIKALVVVSTIYNMVILVDVMIQSWIQLFVVWYL